MPTRPPCSRTAAIVSSAGSPGGTGLVEEEGDQVAVGGLDLLAHDHVSPSGARVASLEGAVDPVVVGDRRGG